MSKHNLERNSFQQISDKAWRLSTVITLALAGAGCRKSATPELDALDFSNEPVPTSSLELSAAEIAQLRRDHNGLVELVNQISATQGEVDFAQAARIDVLETELREVSEQLSSVQSEMPQNTEGNNGEVEEAVVVGEESPIDEQMIHDRDLKVRESHAYGPELGHSRPGYGTVENNVGIVVGHTLSFQTAEGEVVLDGGCNMAILPPETYAKNAGGIDWGVFTWDFNPEATNAPNEMTVLGFEAAGQQQKWEGCEDPKAKFDRTVVIVQDEENPEFVKVIPWREYRRETGDNNVLMFAPGETVYGYHVGLGNSQDNICDEGGCYMPEAPGWGWVGGGVVNPWKEEVEGIEPVTIPEGMKFDQNGHLIENG